MGIRSYLIYGFIFYKGRVYWVWYVVKMKVKLEVSWGSEDICVVFGCDRLIG